MKDLGRIPYPSRLYAHYIERFSGGCKTQTTSDIFLLLKVYNNYLAEDFLALTEMIVLAFIITP